MYDTQLVFLFYESQVLPILWNFIVGSASQLGVRVVFLAAVVFRGGLTLTSGFVRMARLRLVILGIFVNFVAFFIGGVGIFVALAQALEFDSAIPFEALLKFIDSVAEILVFRNNSLKDLFGPIGREVNTYNNFEKIFQDSLDLEKSQFMLRGRVRALLIDSFQLFFTVRSVC